MNWLDIIILVIFTYCLIRGIFRGMLRELSSIIGVLAGFYAAYTYYPLAGGWLGRFLPSAEYLDIIGFLLIFTLVFLLVGIVGFIIKYLLNITFLGWTDRVFGAAFGMVKAVLIAAILLIALTAFLPKGSPVVKQSRLSPYITMLSENMALIVSKELKTKYLSKIKVLKKEWQIH